MTPKLKPQGFDPPESTDHAHTDPETERLGGMTADYTTPEEL
jgi:hypothetical protein